MKINIFYKLIIILLLPLVLLLTTVEIIAFDTNYYVEKYKEYEISNNSNISQNDLKDITDKLVNYLKDSESDLNIEKNINGEMQEVFGEREKLHMIDVKELFIKGKYIRNISLLFIIISLIMLVIKDKKKIGSTLTLSSVISFTLIGLLLLIMYIDFDKYFTYFHEIFFTNDLWLLDPKTDVLIQMLPLQFFYSIATKIASLFILELIILIIVGLLLNKRYKNSLKGND